MFWVSIWIFFFYFFGCGIINFVFFIIFFGSHLKCYNCFYLLIPFRLKKIIILKFKFSNSSQRKHISKNTIYIGGVITHSVGYVATESDDWQQRLIMNEMSANQDFWYIELICGSYSYIGFTRQYVLYTQNICFGC